jgi:hypothetical protein
VTVQEGSISSSNLISNLFFLSMLCRTSDVKCLHAHVADELIRDDNSVGQQVLAEIVAAGDDPSGCDGMYVHVVMW